MNKPFSNEYELRVRQVEAQELLANSLQNIALNFSRLLTVIENDMKQTAEKETV